MRSGNANTPALQGGGLLTRHDLLTHGPRDGLPPLEEVLARSRQARERGQALLDRGKTILVVEQRDIEREGLAAVLRRAGYTVLTAANGRQALEQFVGDPRPRLVLLDLDLAGINGWDILQIRKRSPTMATVPVIVVTGPGTITEDRVQALGMAGYLRKPLEIPTLLETVRHWC